jgi:hypothetical protein
VLVSAFQADGRTALPSAALVFPVLRAFVSAVDDERRVLEQQRPARVYTRVQVQSEVLGDDMALTARMQSAAFSGCFVGGSPLPQRLPGEDSTAAEVDDQTCRKPSHCGRRSFTGSLMFLTCGTHNYTYGFYFTKKGESPLVASQHLHCYVPRLDRVVYDMSCRAQTSAIHRRPAEALNVVFKQDLFHLENHTCSSAYNPKAGDPAAMHHNTSISEHKNAMFTHLANSLRSSDTETATKLLKYAMKLWQQPRE